MKYSLISCLMCIVISPVSALAVVPEALPPIYKNALKDAHASGNSFVIDAVLAQIKQKAPDRQQAASMYLATVKHEEAEKERQKQLLEAKKDAPGWKGSVDLGGSVSTGNTEEKNINANTKLTYKFNGLSNITALSARGSSDDGETTNEKYLVNNQTRYKLSPNSYGFLELEYVKDRFSGFEYRISELLGYGYKWIENDEFRFSTEAGAGARQSKIIDEGQNDSLLGKLAAYTEWDITNGLSIENDTSFSFASDAVITISDTSLKNKLTEALYLKVNHNFQHTDDVPADKKKIDTLTTVGVGYEF